MSELDEKSGTFIIREIGEIGVYYGVILEGDIEAVRAAGKFYGEPVRLVAAAPAPTVSEPVALSYTNYRGEVAIRTITPKSVFFGATDWHPEPQWLLLAFDHDKQADRAFALKDFAPAPTVSGDDRSCTCHPDDNPPQPCPHKYALSECREAALRARLAEAERDRDRLVKAQRQPSTLYQGAEEFCCSCGAAGSGEGHAEWCGWIGSEWQTWGDAFDRAASLAAELAKAREALEKIKRLDRHPILLSGGRSEPGRFACIAGAALGQGGEP